VRQSSRRDFNGPKKCQMVLQLRKPLLGSKELLFKTRGLRKAIAVMVTTIALLDKRYR
jgi:hypothetical protein